MLKQVRVHTLCSSNLKAPPKYGITSLPARKRLPITLTPTEEAYLQRIEYTHPKPRRRLRAQFLRRAARGETAEQIAKYVPLHPDAIKRLLTRFRKYRLAVLEDRPHPGRAPVLTPEMRATLTPPPLPRSRRGVCLRGVWSRRDAYSPLLRCGSGAGGEGATTIRLRVVGGDADATTVHGQECPCYNSGLDILVQAITHGQECPCYKGGLDFSPSIHARTGMSVLQQWLGL